MTAFQNSRRLMVSNLALEKRATVESVAANMAASNKLTPAQYKALPDECKIVSTETGIF